MKQFLIALDQLANTIAGCSGMYSVPLSPTGDGPATHWASSGPIQEEFAILLSSPEALTSVAVSYGMDPALLVGLVRASDISDLEVESFDSALERLGLKRVAQGFQSEEV